MLYRTLANMSLVFLALVIGLAVLFELRMRHLLATSLYVKPADVLQEVRATNKKLVEQILAVKPADVLREVKYGNRELLDELRDRENRIQVLEEKMGTLLPAAPTVDDLGEPLEELRPVPDNGVPTLRQGDSN